MTQNRRIILNIISTYGRSLYSLACGIFTIRWVLAALGTVDYGLYGVVGGLTGFVTFISFILQGATSRFYAYSIGEARKEGARPDAVLQCRKWFNTSVCIHFISSLVLFGGGYFVGVWAITDFLDIPSERVVDCLWVFRFSCLACAISMMSVPYYGMYIAKQFIAELTLYGVGTTTFNAIVAYYMFTHPSVWLRSYSGLICFSSVVPQFLIVMRATYIFPECKIDLRYWFSFKRFAELANYAGWNFIGALGRMLQTQGTAVLINKYFGARINAGFALANTINNQCQSLVTALRTAFIPAITTLCGAGEKAKMDRMAIVACKFSTVLAMFFVIPISMELRQILDWWLLTPPPAAVELCWCIMAAHIIENVGLGHSLAICAEGRVAKYQILSGGIRVLILPLAWCLVALGGGVCWVGITIVALMGAYTCTRAFLAKSLVGMQVMGWLRAVVIPTTCVAVLTFLAGSIPIFCFQASIFRVMITGIVCELAFIPLVWIVVLTDEERTLIVSRFPVLQFMRVAHG